LHSGEVVILSVSLPLNPSLLAPYCINQYERPKESQIKPIVTQSHKRITATKKSQQTQHNKMIPVLPPKPSTTTPVSPHQTNTDTFFRYNYSKSPLKSDHENRPIWICANLHLYLEKYSPIYKQAYDFLIAISDPVSRPFFIHEYVISQYSLYAAASLGLSTEDIIFGLQRLAKNQVPTEVSDFIKKHTQKCGKVKLLLKDQRYYIESPYKYVLDELISGSDEIKYARSDININLMSNGTTHHDQMMYNRNADPNAHAKRTALQTSTDVNHEYDESGYIIQEIDNGEEEFFLQGTGTIDKDGKRVLSKIDQRAAMGMGELDGNYFEEFDSDFKKELFDDDLNGTSGLNLDDIDDDSDDGDDGDDDDDDDDDDAFYTSDSDDDVKYTKNKKGKKIKKAPKKLTQREMHQKAQKKEQRRLNRIEKYRLRKEAKEKLKGVITPSKLYSFEVFPDRVEGVRAASNRLGYPMLEEYDFRNDHSIDDCILPMSLRPQAQIREYQEKALSKMFGNGRARSGIIVLPCGAGKTLVGITAMATVNRSCLIVVSTGVAAQQWKEQVKLWTTLPEEYIYVFASGMKLEITTKPKVVIATYSMLAYEQKRSPETQKIMDAITSSEWGLLLLDEVHVAPADKFKKCITVTHSRCKLGLTATLVREDDKVVSLIEMIGPKLYEASWLDLSMHGFIATVRCYEVWCPMTAPFYKEYLKAPHHLQRLLYVTNPNKFQTLEALMVLHEARGDKIMIFCEDTVAIELFSAALKRPALLGKTKDVDRLRILKDFSSSPRGDSVLISKIGDNSIDLPDTNVIIQISSHYASRRQEAQRLGRILRPKSQRSGAVDAHFYSLVSQDTNEMLYATKRQRFLVDQGYAYKVLKQDHVVEQTKHLFVERQLGYSTKEKQKHLLDVILGVHGAGAEATKELRNMNQGINNNNNNNGGAVRKNMGDDFDGDYKDVKRQRR
jgi:DNA excision repair protein ERCC-3